MLVRFILFLPALLRADEVAEEDGASCLQKPPEATMLKLDDKPEFIQVSGINSSGHVEVATVEFKAGSAAGAGSNDSAQSPFANSVCVDYSPQGYFKAKRSRVAGIPPGFVSRPSTISACEIELLRKDCLDRINMYRSGALKFTDRTHDSNVLAGLAPLEQHTGDGKCSGEMSLGDLVYSKPRGYQCNGAHHTMSSCGESAQNSCCVWHKDVTYEKVKANMFNCLQRMWDEGVTPGVKGHWETMRHTAYTHVSCGFSWGKDNYVNINQDFFLRPDTKPCSCVGKAAGDSDGCGGTCQACVNPPLAKCVDQNDNSWVKKYGGCKRMATFGWCKRGGSEDRVREKCALACGACPKPLNTCPGSGGQEPPDAPVPAPTPPATRPVPAPPPSATKPVATPTPPATGDCEDDGTQLSSTTGKTCEEAKRFGWCTLGGHFAWIADDCPAACGKCSGGGGGSAGPGQPAQGKGQCVDVGAQMKQFGRTCEQAGKFGWCTMGGDFEYIKSDCAKTCGTCNQLTITTGGQAREEVPEEERVQHVIADIPELTTKESLMKVLNAITDRMASILR